MGGQGGGRGARAGRCVRDQVGIGEGGPGLAVVADERGVGAFGGEASTKVVFCTGTGCDGAPLPECVSD